MGKNKNLTKNNLISRAYEVISNSLRKYLDEVAPGTISRIDWHFMMNYGESFAKVFIRDPIMGYRGLLDFFGGDPSSTNYFLYFILKGLFGANRYYVDEAYRAILNRDSKKFKQILHKIYSIE